MINNNKGRGSCKRIFCEKKKCTLTYWVSWLKYLGSNPGSTRTETMENCLNSRGAGRKWGDGYSKTDWSRFVSSKMIKEGPKKNKRKTYYLTDDGLERLRNVELTINKVLREIKAEKRVNAIMEDLKED